MLELTSVADLDINELSDRADVTPRTVHFYIQQGLLAPAGSPGPAARYSEGHVSRIRLIRLLQKQHLPLAEIARRTKGLSDDQVAALIAEARQKRSEPRGSALDYIRTVMTPAPQLSRAALEPEPERAQWERFTLADGIELHLRRPATRVGQRQFEKLMTAARKIFSETEGDASS